MLYFYSTNSTLKYFIYNVILICYFHTYIIHVSYDIWYTLIHKSPDNILYCNHVIKNIQEKYLNNLLGQLVTRYTIHTFTFIRLFLFYNKFYNMIICYLYNSSRVIGHAYPQSQIDQVSDK